MKNSKTILVMAAVALFAVPVFAQEAATAVTNIDRLSEVLKHTAGWMALAAGLGIGLAVFGAALGQGRAAAAALEGIARNPAASGKLTTPLILSLALIESLVILTFLITNGISSTLANALAVLVK